MSSSAARYKDKSSCLVLVMHAVDERPGQELDIVGPLRSLAYFSQRKKSAARLNSGRRRIALKSVLKAVVVLHKDRDAQGLVEYLLILALVALGAIAGMHALANGINSAFSALNSILGTYIT
jgi:Flp pilus assembly pilin Flp